MMTGRRPFQPLGVRLRSFARGRINAYLPAGEGVQRQSLPPSWQTDAQTPLNWGEESTDSTEAAAPQGIPFEATEREVIVPATYLAPNPPSVQTAPAAPPASPQMTRFQILRDIWDKYEARKQAELDAHNSAFASRSEQSSASAVQSQVSGETPPQRRIQPRRRRGAVVDITPPKQLPITGDEAPDENDSQDFFFVGGDTPSPSTHTASEPSSSIQRDFNPPERTEPVDFSPQTFERAGADRPASVEYPTATTVQTTNRISSAAPVQRDVSESTFTNQPAAQRSPSGTPGDDAASWQPNGMIYMPSDNPVSPQPPPAAQPPAPAVQTKRAPTHEPSAPPSHLADTQVSQITPLRTPAAVQPSRDDEESRLDKYAVPSGDTPAWGDSEDSAGWQAQVTPAVQQPHAGSPIQPMRDEIAPSYHPDPASFAEETVHHADITLPSASSVEPPAQSDEGWKAQVTPKSSTTAPAVQPKRAQPAANTPSISAQAGSPGAFESPPSTPTQPSIQTKRETHTEAVTSAHNVGAQNISPSDEAASNWNIPPAAFSLQDAPTALEPPAVTTSKPAAVQAKRDPSGSSNAAPSAPQSKGSRADTGESWSSMASASPGSGYSATGTGFSTSAAEDAPTVFNLPAAAPAAVQASRSSTPLESPGASDNYANWQPSAELAPEPAPDFAPPSPWLNFMSAPEPADPPGAPVSSSPASSRVQRKRGKQQPASDQGAPSHHIHHPDSTPLTSAAEPSWATSEPDLQRDSGDFGIPQHNVDVFTALYQAGMIKEPVSLAPNDAQPNASPAIPMGNAPSAPGSIQRAPDPFSAIPEPGSVEAGLLAMLNLPPDTPVAGLKSSTPSQTAHGTQPPAAPNISREINPSSTGKAANAQPLKPSSPSMASAATMTTPTHTTTTVSNPPLPSTPGSDSDSSIIQRVLTSDDSAADDSTTQSDSPEVNVDQLAREVYDILRSKLRTELERRGGI